MVSELRPKQILRDIGRQWPEAWQQVKKFRSIKGQGLDWPDWCYLPIAAGVAIATGGENERLYQVSFSKLPPAVITAAASWRVSQGVYRFDADLYNSLISQPLDGNVPCEALKRLPEWCVYIECMSVKFGDSPIVGFWAHLESDANDNRMELRLVLMLEGGDNIPVPVHLGDWTLEEGIARMQTESEKQAAIHSFGNLPKINFTAEIVPLVQLVLYLCAENADMPVIPRHPLNRVRMSGQVDVLREPKFWSVGERIGTAIRKYRNEIGGLSESEKTPGTHASPRPFIRRAHWHHFWAGPMQGDRKLILRWLPPIPVGVDEDEGPVVIHKVK